MEVDRLKAELEAYKGKEEQWLRRWQQIAFNVQQKGMQMASVDKTSTQRAELPYNTETAQTHRPFDKEIPPSGRI